MMAVMIMALIVITVAIVMTMTTRKVCERLVKVFTEFAKKKLFFLELCV